MGGLGGIKTNEYTSNLIVADDEYLLFSAQYRKYGQCLEESLQNYLSALRSLAAAGQGMFATNLSAYAETVSMLASNVAQTTFSRLGSDMDGYIFDIDSADGTWD